MVAADLEGLADQVMVREHEVWARAEEFMAEKCLEGLER